MTRNEARERKDTLRLAIEGLRLDIMQMKLVPADDGPLAVQERRIAIRKKRLAMTEMRNEIAEITLAQSVGALENDVVGS